MSEARPIPYSLASIAAEPPAEYGARYQPPPVDRPPYSWVELHALFKGGEPEADRCEATAAWASRARGAIDVGIGERLEALCRGERLPQLGYHLGDYAREALSIGERTAQELVRLARALRTRPLLREAVTAGRVRLGAALVVLPVARDDGEAAWAERAATETVRALRADVRAALRAAGRSEPEEDEPWLSFTAEVKPEERAEIDEGLELAGRLLPGSTRAERLEAMAQEFLGSHPLPADHPAERDPGGPLLPAFRPSYAPARDAAAPPGSSGRPSVSGHLATGEPGASPRADRKAVLESETDRWSMLKPVADFPEPPADFSEAATAQELDAQLRALARLRAGWNDLIGFCAHAIRESRLYLLLGFSSFQHYVEERLQLPFKAVAQRVSLEKRLWVSPALREARSQKVDYEKLRALSRLPEGEITSWIARAKALTCIALRRRLAAEEERKASAARKVKARLPLRMAAVLSAAIEAVRAHAGLALATGRCLSIIARHFAATWNPALPRKTGSRRVRERDGDFCTVPGCSHRATDAHHLLYRAHGGGDEPDNQTGVCGYHHHRCLHAGYAKVWGRAPDDLTWVLGGVVIRPGNEG